MYFASLTPIVFFSCLQCNIPRYPALRHHYPPGALCKTGVSLFKKYYSTECYIRSSKQESGLAKMNHQLSHHVKQRSPGTHSTSWHFTQSKKTHTRLNTDRSITQTNINAFYSLLYVYTHSDVNSYSSNYKQPCAVIVSDSVIYIHHDYAIKYLKKCVDVHRSDTAVK